ncbi:MAG: T9SS type A sorting domain-containing protein [Bacteroidia bacterium]|nr:T9SS type A sorting domain-containing protein [Bacteroidia bacterium]
MKKAVILITLSFVLVLSLAILGGGKSEIPANAGFDALFGGGMDNPGARAAWDLKRLADPSGKIPPAMRARELAFAATLPQEGTYKADSLLAKWKQRGPWNLGGRTRAFAVDVTNPNTLFAGGVSGGLWRSADAGANWTRITPPGAYPGVNGLVQDRRPGKTNIWYLLTGEAYGTSASGGEAFYLGDGVRKSTDGGLTFTSLASTVSGTPQTFDNAWDATWNLSLNPADTVNDVVYAAILGAIMRSTNGGTSWTKVRGSVTSNLSYFTNVMCTPGGAIYATLSSEGTNPGIWRSDNGITWNLINPPFMPTKWGRIVSAYNPLDENRIYFLAAEVDSSGKLTRDFRGEPEWSGLWRYTYLSGNGAGGGGKWENLSDNIPASGGPFDEFIAQGGYNLVALVNPWDTSMVIIGGTNLYRSTTAFNDSTHTTHIGGYEPGAPKPKLVLGIYPNQHPDHHVIFFHPTLPNVLLSANDGGIFKTNDVTSSTVSWDVLNNGYMVSQFYTVALDHGTSGDATIIGGLQDNGTWFNNTGVLTDSWKFVSGGDGSYCHIEDGGAHHYYSKQLGVMAKCSTNSSGVVTAFERIDPIGASGQGFINPFVIDPNDQNVMYFPAGSRVWRNSDLSGISLNNGWDSISTNWTQLADTVPGGRKITSIAVSASPANRLYVGTDEKYIYRVDDADGASPTWTYLSSSLMPATGYVSCLAVHPDSGDKVIAVFSNYGIYSLWYSEDAGLSWDKIAGNLEQFSSGSGNGPSLRWAKILPLSDGIIYLVATSTGLYGTDTLDGLNTVWTQLSPDGIGNSVVDMIDWRRSDGQVVVATHGAGIWTATMKGAPIISREPTLESEFPRVSVFPNPVTAASQVSVELSQADLLEITLTDLQGRVVRTVHRGQHAPGKHQFPLNIQGLSAGIYHCRVRGNQGEKSVKFQVR